MHVKNIYAIIILGAVLSSLHSFSQKVILPSGVLSFLTPPDEKTTPDFYQSISFENHYYFAAYFAVLPDTITLKRLQQQGTVIAERLALNTYLLETSKKPTKDWCESLNITGISRLSQSLKMDKRIRYANIPEFALSSKDVAKVMVAVYGNASSETLMATLEKTGFQFTGIQRPEAGIFSGTAPFEKLDDLAMLPFVYAIRLQNPEDKNLNDIGRASSGTALLSSPLTTGGRNLNGSGVTVGVGDDSDPTLHPDIRDRVINHTPGITNNHGAHVAGTVGGAGILNYRRAGFAPSATIVSQWFSGIWTNAATYTDAYNMVITNNSYGSITGDCIYAGVYDLYSRLLDLQAFEYPQLLHAFAAGNDGDNTCIPFPKAYHTVLGGYQSAKNILTVGRTDYTQVSSSSSSSGPVKDGRLKPEITGLGIINSLNGTGTGYFTEFGTSMSSPNIAGGLALLYERYRQLHGGTNPAGALIKAILLNGARDVGNMGPDFRHGYGTMMLERSLRILENKQYSSRNISQGQQQDTSISVPANTQQLKIMLYWHDPAANVLATNTLVHNLDLEVIGPGNQIILPKILNASSDLVTNAATAGIDNINNQEQVVIDNLIAGNYTIRVKGTEILTLPHQPYSIAIDYVPTELRFTNPINGSVISAGNLNLPIAWEDEGTQTGNYTLEYSLDNGANWTTIVEALKDSTRLYFWQPGSIRSLNARLRISKGLTVTTSAPFAIIPNVSFSVAPANEQCFGFFRINWTALTPAEGETIDYVVKMKKGPVMETLAQVNGTNFFIINNLHPDSTYYAAVVARINGTEGVYNTAINRRPNNGNCTGTISNGHLKLDSILAPKSGRVFTTTALTENTAVTVRIRNLDDVATTSFVLKYNVNGGAFTEAIINTAIGARSTYNHTFPATDFSAVGTYNIVAVVTNTGITDPNPTDDTLRITVVHLPNEPLLLTSPLTEDFELATNLSTLSPVTGLAGLSRWDYVNEDPLARLRTFVTPGVARSGQRAISLDVSKATPRITQPFNQLIGTFNLKDYNLEKDEIRLDFYVKHHGMLQVEHPQNKVWIRGRDTDNWIELYDLGANQSIKPGIWKLVTGLDLTEKIKSSGQSFSTSTQIRFGQYGLYSMADNENFAGYTFDDVSLFKAQNDAQLTEILTPKPFNCGQTTNLPVKLKVRNGMPAILSNIPVRYRINNGNWITESINTIAPKTEFEYTFNTTATLPLFGFILIEAEVNYPGDNIPGNNALQKQIINQPVISTFPYYQDFETGPSGFVAGGINNSWEFGTPASLRITGAASGTKAWKTRLIGDYNNNEKSYLYSPCFDISTLSNPMLSFSLAYSFEDCRRFNVICDAGWMEYSFDGLSWQKLGSFGDGESWYDYESGQVWMDANRTTWREAIISLPAHKGIIKLRYVINSDDGSTREGMAIDNFHVYNGGALPLRWLWFDANLTTNNNVALNWRVANPKAGETFDIQQTKQPDIENSFFTVGRVTAIEDITENFSFTDAPDLKQGILFYRIIWNKLNGEKSISSVRKINLPGQQGELLVFPNPADQKLQLLQKAENDNLMNIRILDVDGRIIFSMVDRPVNGVLNVIIDLTPLRLKSGMYFVEVGDQKKRQVRKWIKR
jgi:hypothetical protein